MKTRKHSQTGTMIVLVIVFLLIVNFTLGFILTDRAGAALKSLIKSRMLDISNTAAAMIDGDDLVSLTKEDSESDEYKEIMHILTYYQDNIELKYIYCIKDLGNRNFVFSVDPTVEDPGEFGSPIVYTDALYTASLGTPAVDDEPYTDDWGTFYSAYSPVFTSDGKVAGIVAVDFDADWYNTQVSDLALIVATVGITSMLAGVLIILMISQKQRKKYRTVYRNLNELAIKIKELVKEIEHEDKGGFAESFRVDADRVDEDEFEDIDLLGSRILSMQDEIREHISLVHELAYLDGLTGVRNKSAYLETVKNLEEQIRNKTADFAVVVFDLNGLKNINDNQGHVCGDIAISDAAACLKAAFDTSRLFRIGGDEFICILMKSGPDDVKRCFERLDSEIAEINKRERSYKAELGISKGAAIYDPEEDTDFTSVFKRADLEMYEDKKNFYLERGDRRRDVP